MRMSRVGLAEVLDRAQVLRAMLAVRSNGRLPWRWLTIFAYHRVAEPGSGYDPDVVDADSATFERQLAMVTRSFTLVGTDDLIAHQAGERPLPANAAMLTFDDGYRDNYDVALPILQKHGAKATFFIASDFVERRRLFWWEIINLLVRGSPRTSLTIEYPERLELSLTGPAAQRIATQKLLRVAKDHLGIDVPRFLSELRDASGTPFDAAEETRLADRLIMNWEQVRALHEAGMDVQSHGHSHRVLTSLAPDEAESDLRQARQLLESHLDKPVLAVAYPTGVPIAGSPELRDAVTRAGYRIGFTCGYGVTRLDRGGFDPLNLGRITVYAGMSDSFFRACLAMPPFAW